MSVADRLLDGLATATRGVARVGLRTWLRLEVDGAEHVPAAGGVILAASHESHADSPAIGAAVGRRLSFLGAADLVGAPVLGPFLPRLGLVPVERGTGDAGLLEVLAGVVRDGGALVVYPEGSRSRDGLVHRPRSGVARLAVTTGAPVVPVGITGTPTAWPVDARPRLAGRAPVTVRFGAPLVATDASPRGRRQFAEELHATLASLSGRPAAASFAPVGGVA